MGLCYDHHWLQAPVEATLRACPRHFGEHGHLTKSTMSVGVPVTLATLAICAASLWGRVQVA
jgi:hypothetical protein